jgi:hypothetical protein
VAEPSEEGRINTGEGGAESVIIGGGVLISVKRLYSIVFLICGLSAYAYGQVSVEGYWEGAIVRDGAVRILKVNFFKDGDALKARFEIPDLITYGLPIMDVKQETAKITWVWGRVAPEYVETMLDWLLKHVTVAK